MLPERPAHQPQCPREARDALDRALFARGLVHLPAANVATLTLLEPLTAATLGVVILGGLLTSTLLNLFVVPALYAWMARRSEAKP